MIGSVMGAFVFIGILGETLSAFTQQPTSDTKLDPAIFDSYLGTYQFPSGYKGPILAVFGELDAQTPVAAVVPRFTEAIMARPASDFTVSVFANASHVMLETTRASDAELERLQRIVPGFYDFVSEWLTGRLHRSIR